MTKTPYRPDIDGLRALAVLAVIIYHAYPSLLPGGFIGVDVFFVISGYLISGHIFKDLDKNNFKIREFYRRRIRRIFPSLIIVLLATLVLGWLFFLPDEFHNLGKHVVGATWFVSNFISNSETGYFEKSSALKPLLHLWSLGVEEQYYIFWPLALTGVWKFKGNPKKWILLLMTISFVIEIFYVYSNPSGAFYLPQGRIWELLLGSLAATSNFDKILNRVTRQVFSATGLAILIVGFFIVLKQGGFPGFWALIPTFGTLFIIVGQTESLINRKLLSQTWLVSIGLISYPLYLWHWPLLSFSKLIELPTSVPVALSFVFAFLTYYYVERPVRVGKKIQTVQLIQAIFIIFILGWITARSGIQCRLMNSYIQNVSDASGDWVYPGIGFDGKNIKTNLLKGKTNETILFLGDSHIEQYWPRFEYLSKAMELNQNLVFASYDGCLPLPHMQIKVDAYLCEDIYNAGLKMAFEKNVKKVVFGGYWEQNQDAFNSQDKLSQFEVDLKSLKDAGKEIVIILSNPTGPEFDPKHMVGSRWRVPTAELQRPLDRNKFEQRYGPVEAKLRSLAQRVGATLIDPVLSMCNAAKCPTVFDGKPIYKDADHMRPFYARERADFVDSILSL